MLKTCAAKGVCCERPAMIKACDEKGVRCCRRALLKAWAAEGVRNTIDTENIIVISATLCIFVLCV